MAFAAERPVLAHSEYRAVDDVVRAGARFEVVSEFEPAGDQPAAIEELERRIRAGERDIVLLGATGTGKSATTAWLIERLQRPTMVMAPNIMKIMIAVSRARMRMRRLAVPNAFSTAFENR